MDNAIVTRNLNVHRQQSKILDDLSFQMCPGRVLGVLGANGAGKTSLLCTLAGELCVHSGQLLIDGNLLCLLNAKQQARMRAVLPQQSTLSFNLDLFEVISMGAYPFTEASVVQLNQWVEDSINDCDLQHLKGRLYIELSGGEQQRVQLARVLVQARAIAASHGHAYILLDEPSASLDPKHQHLIMRQIHRLAAQEQFGVLIIMHDINLAARWCDAIMLLKQGRVIAQGVPAHVLTPQALLQTYDIPMSVVPHPLLPDCVWVVMNEVMRK